MFRFAFVLLAGKITAFFCVDNGWISATKGKINPLPHKPILGFSSSAANKNMFAKIWMNGDTIIC